MAGYHQFLVGRYRPGRAATCQRGDERAVPVIGFIVEVEAEPVKRLANPLAYWRSVLADTRGENESVESAQGGSQSTDLGYRAIYVKLHGFRGQWIVAGEKD